MSTASARRALVTGAGGFVGANLVRKLRADGHAVVAAVRPGGDPWRLAGVDVETAEVELRDRAAVERLIGRARPEWLFHLAAHGAYSWQTASADIVATNALGTVHLLDASGAAGCEAFVHAGTSSEYGFKDHAPSEDELLEPTSAYAVGKAAATLHCRAVAVGEDRHACTLRLYSAYGPWEEPGRLVPTLVAHALRGTLPPLVDPEIARDFLHVDDVCEAFVRAAARPDLPRGTILNLGSGIQTTLAEIVAVAQRELGVEAEPAWGAMERRTWDTTVWVADPRRAAELLGWRPSVTLAAGLRRFAGWLSEAEPAIRDRYRVER